MRVPNQTKPVARDARRRPQRFLDPERIGLLPLNGEDEYEEDAAGEGSMVGESEEANES